MKSDNSYLQSKALWNDLYGSVQVKLENAYRLVAILALVIVITVVGLVTMALHSRVEPFVTVLHGDEVLSVSSTPSKLSGSLKAQLATYFVKQFITQARSVSSDGEVNTQNQLAIYSQVSGSPVQVVKDFYQSHSPNKLAEHAVKTVEINSVLRLSAKTYTIRWLEIERDVHSGMVLNKQRYIAQVSYAYNKPPSDSLQLHANPLGFYITELSWSQDITQSERGTK